MSNKHIAYAALVLTVGCQPIALSAQSVGDFQLLYADLRKAMDSRQEEALDSLLTPDFQSVDIQGHVTGEKAMMAELRQTPLDPNRRRVTTVNSVQVQGGSALVVQSYSSSFQRKGPDGAMHQIDVDTRSNDTWIKPGDRWLLQTTRTRAMTVASDGAELTSIDLDKQPNAKPG
jgi:hypothetical protein